MDNNSSTKNFNLLFQSNLKAMSIFFYHVVNVIE